MKLHIGCGKKVLPGFIHVDVEKHEHVDAQCDIRKLDTCFEPGTVDEIYACHVIEHVSRHEILALFASLHKLLKPGGILRMAVPDIEQAIALYCRGMPLYPNLYGLLWGGQRTQYDYHTVGFDFATLSKMLESVGFSDILRYEWRDFLPDGFDDYSRSYMPHMDFDNGTLVSLNVTAMKPMPVRRVVAFCTGGMCNALGSLFAGTAVAKKLGLPLHVYWIDGYIALDAHLTDLFDVDEDSCVKLLNETEFKDICTHADMVYISHMALPELHLNPAYSPENMHSWHMFDTLDQLSSQLAGSDKDVFVHTDVFPQCIMEQLVQTIHDTLSWFKLKKEHVDKATGFIADMKCTLGVHIRGTDILHIRNLTHDHIFHFVDQVKRQLLPVGEKLFLCSDDEVVEQKYRDDPLVCMYHGKSYVKKRDEALSWYHDAGNEHIDKGKELVVDGKSYKNYSSTNVVRTKDQVICGWIDLLTLGHIDNITGFVTSSESTYFKMANYLNTYFKWQRGAA